MKLIKEEISTNGKERYVFHIGRDETRLLLGLIHSARKYMPSMIETSPIDNRLKQMQREFCKGLSGC